MIHPKNINQAEIIKVPKVQDYQKVLVAKSRLTRDIYAQYRRDK